MQRNRRGSSLLSFALPAALIGIFAASQISLAPDRPNAETGTLDLAVEGQLWTSEPIRVDATAIALTWQEEGPSAASVRVSDDAESWGPWTDIHNPDDHGPDPTSDEAASMTTDISEAVYVGKARWLQFRILGGPRDVDVVYVDTTGRSRSLGEHLEAFFGRIQFARADAALASPDQPGINPRSTWGGDECRAANGGAEVNYSDDVRMMFIHHTLHSADSNAYGEDDVADLLYAICNFHVGVRGWSDIGYNVLIDKFGRVWEGRAGGLDQPVMGAHTGGFNTYSTGVAFIGDHRQVVPSEPAEQALVEFAAWKLDVHHVDPRSVVTVESFGSTRWEAGDLVELPALAGHRDATLTACPGDAVHYRLSHWANQIALHGGAKIFVGWHDVDEIPGSQSSGYAPAVFPFHLSEEMTWTFTILDDEGTEVFQETGLGIEGSVSWDGTSEGEFVSRGEYVAHIEALPTSGDPAPRPATLDFTLGDFVPPFSDDEGSVHEEDIALIAAAGITTGCAPDLFCPEVELNRWQMALFVTRLHVYGGYQLPTDTDFDFTDIGHLPTEYQSAVNQLAALGVTMGTGPGEFDPDGWVTREQMALFITRWLELVGVPLPDGSDQGFEDIAELPAEHQTAINQLAQLGITTGTAPGFYSPITTVTRQQMASFLARSMSTVPGLELPPGNP